MRRLYSTFADGWPGVGLLLMRLVVGCALIVSASSGLLNNPSLAMKAMLVLLAGCAILLFSGLWTPIAGALVAGIEICLILAPSGNRWEHILIATIGGAVAMLGPGLWSVDARLFGWKRVEALSRRR